MFVFIFYNTKRWMYSHLLYISNHFSSQIKIPFIHLVEINQHSTLHIRTRAHTHTHSSHKQGRSHNSIKHPLTLWEMNHMLTVNQERENFTFTGFTHKKEEKPLHLSSKYIHDNTFSFLHFLFKDETDSMLVFLTRYCMR